MLFKSLVAAAALSTVSALNWSFPGPNAHISNSKGFTVSWSSVPADVPAYILGLVSFNGPNAVCKPTSAHLVTATGSKFIGPNFFSGPGEYALCVFLPDRVSVGIFTSGKFNVDA